MKINDLLVFFPAGVASILAKSIRTDISSSTKQYIEKNHLYHCVGKKETAEKIVDSNYLKPFGYIKNNNVINKSYNFVNMAFSAATLEADQMIKSSKKNFKEYFMSFMARFKPQSMLDESPENKKFCLAVSKFQKEGLEQLE